MHRGLPKLIARKATSPAAGHMHARFADIDGVSVFEPTMEIPEIVAHTPRTVGVPHVAFVDDVANRVAPCWRPFVAEVPDAELRGPDPAVYKNGLLIYQSLWDHDHFARSYAELERHARGAVVHADRAANILSLWCDNYFHWLVDALPRLAVLEAAGLRGVPIVRPETCTAFQRETLHLLEVDATSIPFGGDRMAFESLIWPSGLDPIGFPSPRTATWLRDTFLDRPAVDSRRTRLYVRRTTRTVANEDRLVTVLERLGFSTVEPEALPFAEQVARFSNAEIVLGCHGAGMTNGVFARSGSHIVELFQPGYVNLSTYRLARSAGMRYSYLVGAASGARRRGKNRDVNVDTEALEVILANHA